MKKVETLNFLNIFNNCLWLEWKDIFIELLICFKDKRKLIILFNHVFNFFPLSGLRFQFRVGIHLWERKLTII